MTAVSYTHLIINELSYDRFHANVNQIYRVSNVAVINSEENREAPASAPLASVMLNEYPAVEMAARVVKSDPVLFEEADRKFIEDGMLYVDPSFLKLFNFPLIDGSVESVLKHPRSLILTVSQSQKYFGNEFPIGKEIAVDADSLFYTVTGIIADPPANSHIQFDMLASLSTLPDLSLIHI